MRLPTQDNKTEQEERILCPHDVCIYMPPMRQEQDGEPAAQADMLRL